LAAESGVGERMRFLGSRADVADILVAGDVLLLASRGDGMEGMPAIAIEAGLAGLPVVAYSVAGVPEVVVDGTTGLLAPPGDIDALTERLVALVLDPELRARLGSAARTRCRGRFDIQSVAPLYARVYEEVAHARTSVNEGAG
jgi:glycosyltransferase involved in cell wall biosynthesis